MSWGTLENSGSVAFCVSLFRSLFSLFSLCGVARRCASLFFIARVVGFHRVPFGVVVFRCAVAYFSLLFVVFRCVSLFSVERTKRLAPKP